MVSLNGLRDQAKRTETDFVDRLERLRIEILNTVRPQPVKPAGSTKRSEASTTSRLQAFGIDLLDAAKKKDSTTRDVAEQSNLFLLLNKFIEEGKEIATSQQILESLYFKELRERRSNIKNSHANTYHWIFERDGLHEDVKLMEWLDTGSGAYWIAGKAGSGKSTLMKLLCKDERTHEALKRWAGREHTLITASHFFWSGGNQLQKSQIGLLRSLMYQILQQYPPLIEIVCPELWLDDRLSFPSKFRQDEEELSTMFHRLSQQTARAVKICIFVDGLDEYRGDHREIISILQRAGASPTIKLCLSSRPWNVFQNAFGSNPSRMMLQYHTTDDIQNYVRDILYGDEQFTKLGQTDSRAEDLIDQVVGKANGVFLWVFLVVRSLLSGLTDENDITELQLRVRDLPEDLEDYFKLMLSTIEPFYRAQTAHIFLVSIQATRPQSIVAYSFLEDVIKDPEFALGKIQPLTDDLLSSMYRKQRAYLNARCKDLLEITTVRDDVPYSNYKVDFLHRTVRDFLTTSDIYDGFKSNAAKEFDARRSLLRMHLAQFKALGHEVSRVSSSYMVPLAMEFLYDAYDIEVYHNAAETAHVDEFERITSEAYPGFPSRLQHEGIYSSNIYSDTNPSFLSIAIDARLHKYVDHKLQEKPRILFEKRDQPLLGRALERSTWAEQWLTTSESYFDVEMARLLLQRGANPNEKVHARQDITVWNAFLLKCPKNLRASEKREHDHEYKKRIYKIAEMFVEYGADINLISRVFGSKFEGIEALNASASVILRASLEPADWVKMEALMAERRQPLVEKCKGWLGLK